MSVPYYPQITETPFLGLSLIGMDEVLAQDMILIDAGVQAASEKSDEIGAILQENSDSPVSQFDSISNRQYITADGMYNGVSNSVIRIASGLLVAYYKGTNHTTPTSVGWKTSSDNGLTWSAEQLNTPYYGGPFYWNNHVMPGGTLLSSGTIDATITHKGYWLSTNGGVSWSAPVSFSTVFTTRGYKVGSVAYCAGEGASLIDGADSSFLWKSVDDGVTWTQVSEIRNAGEPAQTETGVCLMPNGNIIAVSRDDGADTNTYVHFSTDGGLTWGPVQDYTSQLGALALPQVINLGTVLMLTARQSNQFQVSMYLSYDNGVTWSSKIVLDTYSTSNINGGYTCPLVLDSTRVLVTYSADCTYPSDPDIKSVVINFKGGPLVNNIV